MNFHEEKFCEVCELLLEDCICNPLPCEHWCVVDNLCVDCGDIVNKK